MNPSKDMSGQERVRYKLNRAICGWAINSSLREIHGIVVRDRPIRREIFVHWDRKYPPGFINIAEIERVN